MVRVMMIVGLVVLFVATGLAGASPADQVRLPHTVDSPGETTGRPAQSVIVRRGDHLWKISERHLGEGTANGEIAPYWRVVIDVNRPRLRSGDPDLIFPGEVIELPEWSGG